MDKYFLITYYTYDGSMHITSESEPIIFTLDDVEHIKKCIKDLKDRGNWNISKLIKGRELDIKDYEK